MPQNTMTEATCSAPEIDSTAPVAVSDTNEANGFFVSPCYFKGKKPADAVDVLWRYNGQTEWHYIQRDDVDAGKDAVVADTWWWTEIC